MYRLVWLTALPACLDFSGFGESSQNVEMSVDLTTRADGTTEITGCWSSSLVCERRGSPVLRSNGEEVYLEFVLGSILNDQTETGTYEGTTDRFVPGVPIEIMFDTLSESITIPSTFEVQTPLADAVVSRANPVVHVAWTPNPSPTDHTAVLAHYDCRSATESISSTATLFTFEDDDPGVVDVDLSELGTDGSTCDIGLLVQHVTKVRREESDSQTSMSFSAGQERRVAITLVP